jgi:hypothetical protein
MDPITPEILQIQLTNGDIFVTEVHGDPGSVFLKRHLALDTNKTCVIRMVRDGHNIRREVHSFLKDKSLADDLYLNTDHIVCVQKVAFGGELANIFRQNTSGIVLLKPKVQALKQ